MEFKTVAGKGHRCASTSFSDSNWGARVRSECSASSLINQNKTHTAMSHLAITRNLFVSPRPSVVDGRLLFWLEMFQMDRPPPSPIRPTDNTHNWRQPWEQRHKLWSYRLRRKKPSGSPRRRQLWSSRRCCGSADAATFSLLHLLTYATHQNYCFSHYEILFSTINRIFWPNNIFVFFKMATLSGKMSHEYCIVSILVGRGLCCHSMRWPSGRRGESLSKRN